MALVLATEKKFQTENHRKIYSKIIFYLYKSNQLLSKFGILFVLTVVPIMRFKIHLILLGLSLSCIDNKQYSDEDDDDEDERKEGERQGDCSDERDNDDDGDIDCDDNGCEDKPACEESDTDTDTDSDTDTDTDADTDTDINIPIGSFDLDIGNGIQIEFVTLPSGNDPLSRYDLSSDFSMMKTEVTQAMFYIMMGFDAFEGHETEEGDTTTYNFGLGNDFPVYYVSWHMGAAFANAVTFYHNLINGTELNECYSCEDDGPDVRCLTTMTPYQCNGYRLPTEAEWEYANRAGTTEEFWTGYGPNLGGDISAAFESNCTSPVIIQDNDENPVLGDNAWYCGNSNYSAQPVGQRTPNSYGLHDMQGNVWEWTADYFGFIFPSNTTDPFGDEPLEPVNERSVRGGGWATYPHALRLSYRGGFWGPLREPDLGFRLAIGN